MSGIQELLGTVANHSDRDGVQLVARAAHFAEESHIGFVRLDGTAYIDHSVGVATILAEWHAPPHIVAAGLLHDVPKQQYSNRPSLAAIEESFSPSVVSLVREVARLGRSGPAVQENPGRTSAKSGKVANHMRSSWTAAALQRNPEAVVIKVADRLHNLESLDALPLERQQAFATAVLNVFAPFADRLGMYIAKRQLQDSGFRICDPERYAEAEATRQRALSGSQIEQPIGDLQRALDNNGLTAQVLPQFTHCYGIHRRRLEKGGDTPTDGEIISLSAVMETVEDCYRAIRVVHGLWRPVNEFYDYIAAPKPNGYRALHTRVWHQSLGAFQLVLSTEEMQLVAEYGITAGWRGVSEHLLPRIGSSPERPAGHVMVLTPKGDIRYLPEGATPIDFAYSIHTEVGHRCMAAFVNGTKAPLNTQLHEGDIVDIIVARSGVGPNSEWKEFVVTDTAKQAIEKWGRRKKELEFTIEAWDRPGLVQDISTVMSDRGLNMTYFYADALVDGRASVRVGLGQIDTTEVDNLEQKLKELSSVGRVERQTPQAPPGSHPYSIASYRNPYTIQPVFGEKFKGRKREIREIVDRLGGQGENNALLVWGQQRIGKTSLLKHLAEYVLPARGYLPVFVDMHDVSGQPIGIFLHRIAYEIQEKVQHETVNAPHPGKMKQEPLYYFRRFMDQFQSQRFMDLAEVGFGPDTLLVILDEFQVIGTLIEEGATRQDVFSGFRSMVQHGMNVNFLFSGGGLPERLLAQSGLSSLLAVVDQLRINGLEAKSAEALVTELDPSLHFTDQAVDRLLEITRCHPCYLQYLCRDLHETASQGRITKSDVDQVIGKTMEWRPKLESFVQHFWTMDLRDNDVIQKNRLVLSAIADGSDSSRWTTLDRIAQRTHPHIADRELTGILNGLADYGSIDADGVDCRIRIPLFEMWLRAIYPLEHVSRMMGE